MGDDGWRSQPKRMSAEARAAVIQELGHLSHSQDHPLSVVMHGGEPLLLGLDQTAELVRGLKTSLRADAGIHVQTNAVLLTDPFIQLFAECDVGISISYDGPVHDRNRLDRRGRGSHDRVLEGIERLQAHPAASRLFSGLLAVVDPGSDPIEVYEALKSTGAPAFDFLYRDGNHVALPYGKHSAASTEYGNWMVRLADHYLADPDPPRIRLLDDLMRLILGGAGEKEGVGVTEYGIVVVDTDGTLTKNDTLKAGHGGGDRFSVRHKITDGDLAAFLADDQVSDYYALQEPTSPICQSCPDLNVCGGGMPTHRWSDDNGYDNPTIFCADQTALIAHLRGILANAIPAAPGSDPPNQTRADRLTKEPAHAIT